MTANTFYLILGAGVFFYLFSCLAIVDIARKDFPQPYHKVLWVMFVVILPIVGVLTYVLWGIKQGVLPGKAGQNAPEGQ